MKYLKSLSFTIAIFSIAIILMSVITAIVTTEDTMKDNLISSKILICTDSILFSEPVHDIYSEGDMSSSTHDRHKIGRCRLTIYTPYESHWGYSTATGARSRHLETCAVDPKLIPYGSKIILVGQNGNELELVAVDCGNFKGRLIDIFYEGKVSSGVNYLVEYFGDEYAEVWIEESN